MNILYSVLVGGWGGLEQYPFTIYPYLKKKKHKIYILVLKNSRAHQECIKRNIPYFTIDKYKKFNLKIIKFMKKIVIDNKIDIVHFNKSREIYNWSIALKKLPTVKLIMTQHIGISNKNDFIHKLFYKRLDVAIAVTKLLHTKMLNRLPVPMDKILLLYNGVDLKKFRQNIKSNFRKEFKIKNNKVVFTAVGNFSPAKGVYEFIEAAKVLTEKYKNVHFVWVGEDKFSGIENFIEDIKELIYKSKKEKFFTFTGFRQDIPAILKESDVFVLPSHNETFGIVYIEAMAMGKPVIGCKTGGVPEIIDDNINGFLVEPENASQLASAMEKYLLKKSLIKKHSKDARIKANYFSMEKHIKLLLKIYGLT